MKSWFDNGLHLVTGGIHVLFDPSDYFPNHPSPPNVKSKPDIVLLSHAHADHSNLIERYNDIVKVMHPATAEIVKNVMYKKLDHYTTLSQKKDGSGFKTMNFKGLKIDAFNSGHCIGSVQFKIATPDGTFVFTGDINTSGSVAMKPGEILSADYLAIESTMGLPSMVSPTREDGYETIYKFLQKSLNNGNNIAVIYGHAIGKGQEMTKMVNFFDGIPHDYLLVGGRVHATNKIYERYESSLGKYYEYKNQLPPGKKIILFYDMLNLKKGGKTVGKMFNLGNEPPSMIVSAFGEKDNGATGQKFPVISLSSHDDFNALNHYVDESMKHSHGVGKVITFHGSHAEFSEHLRSRGYDAIDPHENVLET